MLIPSLLFLTPDEVSAVETYQEGEVILYDDFSDGNLNGWIIESGVWNIDNTQLFGKGTGKLQAGRINNDNKTWDNYRIELDVKNENGVDEGIGFRRTDTNNNYELILRHGTGAHNTPEIIIAKIQNGIFKRLYSTRTIALKNQVSYHIKLEVVEEHIQLWIDNTFITEITDKGTSVKKGSLSLSYWTGDVGTAQIRFDNIKITELSYQLYPVIFIPGISGSELKANQDIVWNYDNGHGGEFKHIYKKDETIWVDKNEALKVGSDDYFDVLKMDASGQKSLADIVPTGDFTPYGYQSVEQFFQDLGYKKNNNFYIYNYDWRKDVTNNKNNLDSIVNKALLKTGYPKVNIVAHSLGGLVATYYISNEENSKKVNKFITLGTPYAGSVDALKTLLYGKPIGKSFFDFITVGISGSEVKDVSLNFPSMYQLLPNPLYYQLYNNTTQETPAPFYDERDIDKNNITGLLNYEQTKRLLINKNLNEILFPLAESLHSVTLSHMTKNKDILYYFIAGVGHPTLGQIKETWFIKWPFTMIDKQDETFINGDAVVPILSALPSSSIFDKNKYYTYKVHQKHNELPNNKGAAMEIVKTILLEGDATKLPVTDKVLAGHQLSVDNGEMHIEDTEGNSAEIVNDKIINTIPEVTLSSGGSSTQHAFINSSSKKVTIKVNNSNQEKVTIKIKQYIDSKITQNIIYKDVLIHKSTPIHIEINKSQPPIVNQGTSLIQPTVVSDNISANDMTPPLSIITVKDENTLYIDAQDDSSGILETVYTVNDTPTQSLYTTPLTFTTPGVYRIKISSIDKNGNIEYPQSVIINIKQPLSHSTPNPNQEISSTKPSISVASAPAIKPHTLDILSTSLFSPIPQVLGSSNSSIAIDIPSTSKLQHNGHSSYSKLTMKPLLNIALFIATLFFPQLRLLIEVLLISVK